MTTAVRIVVVLVVLSGSISAIAEDGIRDDVLLTRIVPESEAEKPREETTVAIDLTQQSCTHQLNPLPDMGRLNFAGLGNPRSSPVLQTVSRFDIQKPPFVRDSIDKRLS